MGKWLCRIGLHKWRGCRRAVWAMSHGSMMLDLCACARCGTIREDDADQLRYLRSLAPIPVEIVEVPHG